MLESNAFLETKIRKVGLRPTRQRTFLAELLFLNGDRHFTAEQLHSETISKNIPISLATIYNNLHQFTRAGILREVIVDASRTYFDTNIDPHHHLFFEDEARLEDIPMQTLDLRNLPPLPPETTVSSIDIIVRIRAQKS